VAEFFWDPGRSSQSCLQSARDVARPHLDLDLVRRGNATARFSLRASTVPNGTSVKMLGPIVERRRRHAADAEESTNTTALEGQ
jgi:hypothetical protein